MSGLALGDYLLWNWSLGGGHDVLAIVSGLSLLPLVLATAWLLALSLARALARTPRPRLPRRALSASRASTSRLAPLPDAVLHADAAAPGASATTASSSKLAA